MTAVVRLAEIASRADAATGGPWTFWPDSWRGNPVLRVGCADLNADVAAVYIGGEPDAVFIAAARTDVPWLVDLARRQAAALRAVLKVHSPTWDDQDHVCVADGSRLTDDVPDCPTVRAIVEALGSERP